MGSFQVIDEGRGTKLRALRTYLDVRLGADAERKGGQIVRVNPGYEIDVPSGGAILALSYELLVKPGPFKPDYDFNQQGLQALSERPLPPCTLDKAALGGPIALLAVASNPYLKEEFYTRWAQCPWTRVLYTIASNSRAPQTLRQQLGYWFER